MSNQSPSQPYGSEPGAEGANPGAPAYGSGADTAAVPPPPPTGAVFPGSASSAVGGEYGSWQQSGSYGGYGYLPDAPNSTLALVFGILGVLPIFIGPLLAPVALILAIIGRSKVKAAPAGTYQNEGRLTAGLVLGIIGTVLLLLYIAALVVVLVAIANAEDVQ